MANNKALLACIAARTGAPDLDVLCSGLMRQVAKAETYELCGDDDMLGFMLEIIEGRLNEIVSIRDALVAAKGAA